MATATDKKRWDDLHAALAKADEAVEEIEHQFRLKYGHSYQSSWLKKTDRDKLEKLRDRADKIGEKIFELVDRISPRDWASGVPSWWVRHDLTWEDMIRPKNEPLSVVPPLSYGSTTPMQEGRGRVMAESKTHPQVEYAVEDGGGHERIFKTFEEAAGFAVGMATSTGESNLDVLIFDEEGAAFYGGDDAVEQYNEDPEASVFERFEIRVNAVGRVP